MGVVREKVVAWVLNFNVKSISSFRKCTLWFYLGPPFRIDFWSRLGLAAGKIKMDI